MADPTSLDDAKAKYTAYYEAETAVLQGQSYTIGGRQLSRADLKEIRAGLLYWRNQVELLKLGGTGRPRVMRIVPR